MQITNAAARLATRLESKRLRRPWNPDLHPRDSKGRFIETGGIARLWGGGMARVIRSLGGRNVLVENVDTRERSTVHGSRLTMVARPDGTAPTKSKKKVRDEDERRITDARRGTGLDEDDPGDHGETPDDPHDKDDQGEDIGEDIDGEDLGEGEEPEDDEPFLPRGRVFQDGEDATQNPETAHYPDALPMPGSRLARHRAGQGDALRAPGGKKKADGSHLKFRDTDHANAAADELVDDYLEALEHAWDVEKWDDRNAADLYERLSDSVSDRIEVDNHEHDAGTQDQIDWLPELSAKAEELAELADRAGKTDLAEAAAALSDALELAHRRFSAHGGKPLRKPRKDTPARPSAWQAKPVAPAKKTASPRVRRDPNRRFKTLADVRAHWASGNVRPFTTSERRQEAHNKAMPGLMDTLEKPQLSHNGHFTIGKLPAKKPSDGPYGWAVTHNDTGIRLVLTPRKAEALDFANRMETAELNGKPIDWNDPSAFDAFRSKEGLELAERLKTEAQQAFASRAAKKRDGAAARTKPAPPTPGATAQNIAAQSGIPAANIGVGHVGAADNDPQGRPTNDDELRALWANGGAPGVSASAAKTMKQLANSNNVKLHLSDHRGFAIVEYIRNSGDRFEVRASGTGQRLMVNPIAAAGVFAEKDTANRFALRLGSEIRDADGKTIDWGSPTLDLKDWRSKDGLAIRPAVLQVAGQFDVDRGAGDSDMVKRAQMVREYRQRQAEAAAGTGQPDSTPTPQPEDSPADDAGAASVTPAPEGEQTQNPAPADAGGKDPVKTHLDRAAASLGPVMNELRGDERWGQRLGRAIDQALGGNEDQDQGFDQLVSVIEEGRRKLRSNRALDSSERRYLDQHAADALAKISEARKVAADRPKPPRPDGQRRPGQAEDRRSPSQERAIAAAEVDLAVDQLILAQRGTLQDEETSRSQIERAQALVAAVRDGETDSAADLGEILAEVERGIRGRTDGLDESSKRYWLNELSEARHALMRAEARLGDIETTDNRRTPPADTGADGSEQVRPTGTDVLGDVPSGGAAVAGQRAGADGVLRGAGEPDSGEDRGSGRDAAEDDAAGDDAGDDGLAAAGPESGDGDRPERRAVPAEGAGDGASGAGRDAAAAVDAARFRPGSQDDLAPSGERAKAKANVAAVRTLRRIQAENRPATPEEQQILARWSGWGSLPIVLSDKPNPNDKKFRDESGEPDPEAYARALKRWEAFAEERAEIRELLDDKEWAAARKNTLNAHYTDSSLVQPVWDAIRSLGFRRGRVLEPGSGSGNFIGHAPDGAEMVGVELDPTSAAISQLLYPDAQVINKPFQELRLPPDSFDLAIGNVPFGRYKLHDPLDNPGRHHSIHDHFILKSLARVRPGGYVALVTSRYTMDSEDDSARRAMYDMADLVGAVRLPEGAHQRAAGTHVVTDLLLFRRRDTSDHTRSRGDDSWLTSSKTNIGGYEVPVNDYFQKNPKNILGQMTVGSGQFTDHDLTVKGDSNTLVSLRAALGRIVADAKTAGLDYDASQQNADLSLNLAGDARDGSIARGENGAFMTVENGNWVELDVHPKQREQLGRLLHLKDLANRLVGLEASTRQTGETDEMREARAALNLAYEAYVRKHPSPNKPGQHRLFSPPEALARRKAEGLKATPEEWKLPTALALFEEDPDGHMVFGLDRWDADAKAPRKLNILSERVLQPREIPEHADTPELAVAYALEHDGGRLNLPTVARLLGMDQDAAREALGDLAFDDPATGRLEPRAAYLSGNVRQKLTEAQAAAAEDPKYAVNVAALERVVPKDIRPKDIRVKIGAPWVPIDIYEGFLRHLGLSSAVVTHHGGNRWSVDGDDVGEIAKKVWGVKGRSAYDIFDSLLHQKLITIKESQEFPDGSKKTFVNQKATSAARTKAKDMAREFQKWVMDDPERAGRLGRIYNDKFNSIALRDYDDSPLTLPGVRDGWRMRPHQNAAIRRITQEPTTLLGHVVGAGKTATMVGGAMELRRTGLAKKPAIVVPNHMLEQFSRETVGLYPGAKVLAISRKDLHHKKRRKFIAKIAGGDWDVVVLTHDAFNAMPMTPQTQQAYMDEELALLRSQIEKIKDRDGDDPSLKQMEQTLANQEEKLKERLETLKDQRGIFFENTGIDYLFVDEAHEYKNLRTVSNLPGAAISGSGQATQLHMALGYLREHNESGRVATLATGTPIANSVTEAYVLMRYLAPQILEDAGIEDFDSWAATFGEVVTSLELAPDGSGEYREKARFAKFFNVPELLVGYRTFADIQTAADLGLPTPPVRAGKNGRRGEVISIPASIEQRRYVESLADEDWIKDPGGVLKAIGFASRAAIDMRLQGGAGHEGGKLDAAAEQIAKLYEEHKDTVYPVSLNNLTPQETPGALQLVFLDEGTPGSTGKIKFDAYEALRDLLVEQGVPREKVRFIHEAKDDKAKAKLFEEARNGKVAVLIGSTQKMGTGTNVQDRAVALHHLSFPWRPADMEQRDGRIERQGNLNVPLIPSAPGMTPDDVRIMYYITEGTFDEFRLGTLERKAVFINQMARRDFSAREMEDIGDAAVSLGTFKAIASGNPAIAERAIAQAELVELQRQNADWYEQQQERRDRIEYLTRRIAALEQALPQMREALAKRQDVTGDKFQASIDGVDYDSRADAAEVLGRRMDAIAKDTRYGDGATVPLGEIGGVGFLAEVEYDRDGNRLLRLRLDHAPAYAHSPIPETRGLWSARKINDSSGRGAIQSLENLLRSLDGDTDKREKELDGSRTARREAEEHLAEGTSPYEEQVESTERRMQALTELVMHHQEARKLTDRIKEATNADDATRLKKRLKEVQQETRTLESMAEQERAKTFTQPEPKSDPTPAEPQSGTPAPAASRQRRPQTLTEQELGDELASVEESIAKGDTDNATVDRHAALTAERARRAAKEQTRLDRQQVRDDLESLGKDTSAGSDSGSDAGADAQGAPAPAPSDAGPDSRPKSAPEQGDVVRPFTNDAEWRAGLAGVDAAEGAITRAAAATWGIEDQPDDVRALREAVFAAMAAQESGDFEDASRALAAARDRAQNLRSSLTDDERQRMEEPLAKFMEMADGYLARQAVTVEKRRREDAQRDRIERQAAERFRDSLRNGQQGTAGDTSNGASSTSGAPSGAEPSSDNDSTQSQPEPTPPAGGGRSTTQQPSSQPASSPATSTPPADMTAEQLAHEIDEVEDQLSPLADSTDPVDLAMRRRLERRLWELENEERGRWEREPEYDSDGKLIPPSRNDIISDRLAGYDLSDAEVQGLVSRVEALPAAKEGGYSDEEWQRISAEASAREDYPPTDEQNIIIEGAARRGLNMAVMALAGTGKSSTLKMLSHRMPGKRIVYLAFNRSVAAEAREAQARGEYAKNMLASTANAYAARVADRRLNDRLPSSRAGGFKKLSAQQIADRMRWYDTVKAGNRDITPGGAATVAERMIREWAKSADAEMGPQHVKAGTQQERRDLFNAVKPLADRMWANLTDPEAGDPDRDLTMDFDYIVKQWALSGYKLDADVLFWDEAQDVNPVMEGVVRAALDQGVQVVAVGDSNQAIYGFRGASDALAKLPVDARATLTQSFRFGPAVADVGNRFLRLLGTRMRLKGYDRKQSRIGQLQPGEESMVIARTNAGVALAAVQALTAGRTVAVSGGVKALQEFVQAANALAAGEDTDHAELARFNGKAFDDIVEEVKTDPDLQQLASLFNLLEKHGDDIEALLASGSRPAATELVGDRVWVRLDWNDPKANDLKRWLGDGKSNGVGKLLYDPATRRYYYEPGKREVPWQARGRSGVHKIDNKLSLEEAQKRIDAHLADLYPQDTDDGKGRLVPEHEPYDVLVTTAHKAKGLESERVRIADDFKGPEEKEDGSLDWDADTAPSDEALRVAYVAVTRATEVLDPGSLGWVFRAVRDEDPTQPPKGEYRRDFELGDFKQGDEVDFLEEDGTPNIGVVSEIDPPLLTVLSTSDEPGVGGKRQEIGPAQVQRRNGERRPLLPVAADEELDQAITEGRFGSVGPLKLNPAAVRSDLNSLRPETPQATDEPEAEESPEPQPAAGLNEEPTGLPDDLDSQWRALADLAPDAPILIQARASLRRAAEALAAGDQETASANLGKAARSMWPFKGGDSSDWGAAARAFSIAADHAAASLMTLRDGERVTTYRELKKGDIVRRPDANPEEHRRAYGRVTADPDDRGREFETWFEYGPVVEESGVTAGFGFYPADHTMVVADENSQALREFIDREERRIADERAEKEQAAAEQEARRQQAAVTRNDELLAQAEGDAVEPDDLSEGDQITVHEGRNNRGQVVTVSGRLLAEPTKVTATRDGKQVPSWRLYVGEEGDELRPGTMYTIERGERVERHTDTTPAPAVPGEGGQTPVPHGADDLGDGVWLSKPKDGPGPRNIYVDGLIQALLGREKPKGGYYWWRPWPDNSRSESTFNSPEEAARDFAREMREQGLPSLNHDDEADRGEQNASDDRRDGDAEDPGRDQEEERDQGDENDSDREDRTRRRGDRDGDAPEETSGAGGASSVPRPDVDRDDVEATDAERNRDRRRRRDRDRDSDRGERDGGAPNSGRPDLPGRDRDRDRDRDRGDRDRGDRDRSGDAGTPSLDDLKNRYRSGDMPTPSGADPQEHAAYLRRLADNNTLLLSPGGGLITWSDDDGRTWQFGHTASGMHLAGWEADGDQIGGREGAQRLAGEYERLRDENGDPIDWADAELSLERLRAWRDADGKPLGTAIEQARQNAISTQPDRSRGGRTSGRAGDDAPGKGDGRNAPGSAGADGQNTSVDTGSGGVSSNGEADNAATGPEPAGTASQYSVNAVHHGAPEQQRAGFVDGRRIPTAQELKQYQTGRDSVISEEGERALFGSPEQMRELAAEGFVPGPVMRSDNDGQVWRDGRLIGTLTGTHLHSNSENPPEVWWSSTPFSDSPHFSSREAAVAHLVLRDKERGEPDLSIVHPDFARTISDVDRPLAFPDNFRGLETLTNNPEDMQRYEALRKLVSDLGRGVTPSGNVADDLAHLHDELRWLNATHYKHQPSNLKDRYILGPGWFASKISEYLDVLRPEDPRAQHHEARKNRAAHQLVNELTTPGWQDRAERVSVGDLRQGDIVRLEGRITGMYAGAVGRQTGYVLGDPVEATFTSDKQRYKGWRVTVSADPFEATRDKVDTQTFIFPVDEGTGLRIARAEDVNLPIEQHQYGRQVGETPSTRTDSSGSAPLNGAPGAASGEAAPASGATGDGDGGTPFTPVPNTDTTSADESSSTPARQRTDSDQTAPSGEADTSRRRQEQAGDGADSEVNTPAAPEPVGGRPAEWVQVSDLQLGDVVRIDGTTKNGAPRSVAGYVVRAPEEIAVTRKRRSLTLYRVQLADNPDARTGTPVWVPLDAAAARATRDDADQFQGAPQTGADSDVLTGRVAGQVPTDASGTGLFPGSVVTDDDGQEGVITGASANSVRVQFGDDRTDDEHAPTSLNVTDGGAARPTGWTPGGHQVHTGHLVGDRDGNRLGTVEEVDGDTATIATPDGMRDMPIGDLQVIGDTTDDDQGAKVARVETVSEVNAGDVILVGPNKDRAVRVTGFGEHPAHGRPVMFVEDTTTGKQDWLPHDEGANYAYHRLVGQDGGTPDLGSEDAPDSHDEITSHEPAPAVDPVTGPTVDPQLSPEERDAITDRGQAPTSSPDAQQAAARIANDLPVTPEQATALAEELREGADSATPEGRATQRAADHLNAAAGNEPEDVSRPEPGTIGSVGEGDTIALPNEFDPDTMTAYRVVQIRQAPAGVRVLTIEDGDGLRFKRSLASSEPLYQLPEPDAPAAYDDAEQRDPNAAPDADKLRSDSRDAVVRAVIDNAIQGTTTPGSIHQLRQQVAEQLTPEALRTAMRRARNGALAAISNAGIEGEERDELVKSLRKEAATARTEAVRAALRTIDDLEPLDGESEEDTANRAADLLRLIPEALSTRAAEGDDSDGGARVNDSVTQHADDAVGEALQAAADSGELLTPERRAAIVQQLAARMDATRNDTARRIAAALPADRRPGILPHIVAALAAIARTIIALVAAFLKALARAWQGSREGLRRMRERITRFRRGLMQRVRSWPETRRLRRLAAAADLPQRADGLPLGDRVAHWARLLPAPGRFGQVSRRARWYRPSSRSSLAAGQRPEVQDGVRWTMDRAVDGGPGPQALRHLAAVRAAGQDVDADLAARLAAAAPELGDDPHGAVRHAAEYADTADRRLRDLVAAAAGGAPDADLEIAAARVEAQSSRQEAERLQRAYAAALPGAVRETLAEVREMGPGTTATLVTTPDSDASAVRALTGVAQFVPRDWLSPTEARFIAARSGDAGGYDPDSRTATVADLGDDGRRTAAHALLAHLQQHYPDLLAAQEAFHFTRTHTGRVGARRRTSLDRLLARLFRNDDGRGETGDLVPLGLGTLFDGEWYEDDDLRAFLLGLLATR
ncbi:UvrD-helicase domain-containing protein [Streptomyces lavendulocolor]|uniref:UvrD-helicase domain-containing protein n=1 Tax=Streptomyces lavendulocolor TaxID=67316 RepID=UPI003C303737